jgi:hypothetical protein
MVLRLQRGKELVCFKNLCPSVASKRNSPSRSWRPLREIVFGTGHQIGLFRPPYGRGVVAPPAISAPYLSENLCVRGGRGVMERYAGQVAVTAL